ncbi:transglutaminase family protein [Opitutaceae bacterium TAV4]|nr:transglutaminase family protein [Opitutaceae bacterium TAV4]RRK02664.1 transglutaminase family protein [Opitutaceae bacterium TAV3]
MPLYRITHTTTWTHHAPVATAWQMLRLQPGDTTGQRCLDWRLSITPEPAVITTRTDYFGNRMHLFNLSQPHAQLVIHAVSRVAREDIPPPALDLDLTPPPALAALQTTQAIHSGEFQLEQYRHPTALVPHLPEAASLAAGLDLAGMPVLTWLAALGEKFGRDYKFDTTVTTIATPLAQVLRNRRGVCQDFAHLFLSCLRQHGLAAAYVSGYLLTEPPPGSPRLLGVDAMHAWISVHVPGTGWIDYDPTNLMFAGVGHITVARGRDYADITPTRGVFSGADSHALKVEVTVQPEDEMECSFTI